MPRLSCLILGGAGTLEADRAAALDIFAASSLLIPDLVIACNHAARDELGRVDVMATMHPELAGRWLADREAAGRPPIGQLWIPRHKAVQCQLEARRIESWGGSSGLLCVAVAFELGASHIVLAGVPMEKLARHYDSRNPWMEARQYWPAWEKRMDVMRGRVRSMSGWTREQLGEPCGEWLDGDGH